MLLLRLPGVGATLLTSSSAVPSLSTVLSDDGADSAHLDASVRGPTGDLDSSSGEVPAEEATCTSCSKLFDSFLSSPASLPVEVQVEGKDKARIRTAREEDSSGCSMLTRVRLQVTIHHILSDIHVV